MLLLFYLFTSFEFWYNKPGESLQLPQHEELVTLLIGRHAAPRLRAYILITPSLIKRKIFILPETIHEAR